MVHIYENYNENQRSDFLIFECSVLGFLVYMVKNAVRLPATVLYTFHQFNPGLGCNRCYIQITIKRLYKKGLFDLCINKLNLHFEQYLLYAGIKENFRDKYCIYSSAFNCYNTGNHGYP